MMHGNRALVCPLGASSSLYARVFFLACIKHCMQMHIAKGLETTMMLYI